MNSGIYALIALTLCGAFSAMLFDVFRAMRAAGKNGAFMTAAEDICFCAVTAFAVWKCLWIFGSGELRLFEILGFAIGAILYILLLQKVILKIFTVIFKNIFKFLHFISQILLTPLRFLYKILLVPLYLRLVRRSKKCDDGKVIKNERDKRKGNKLLQEK